MKKRYIHIKEYELTKMLLDYLDIDIDDDGLLYHGAFALETKSKHFTLVPYKEMSTFKSETMIPLRPFTNINHCNYIINLFSDIYDCETLFEYQNMDDGKDLLEGNMKIEYDNSKKKIKVYGIKNLNILMGAILFKMIVSNDKFKSNISSILKLDNKVTKMKEARNNG